MEFYRTWALRGPNRWARCTALEAEVDLGELQGTTTDRIPGFADRRRAWLPSLDCDGESGFLGQVRCGVHLAHVLERVALELQRLAGSEVSFGLTRETIRDGLSCVVVEYEEEALGRAALEAARGLVEAAAHDRPFDVAAELARLRALGHEVRLGPSTGAIVRAARRRNIPARRLNEGSFVLLGQGARQRRVWTAETDGTSAVAQEIAQDKQLTRALLRAVGVPVPDGRPVGDAEDAWNAAEEVGLPVVVKPRYGNQGRGVATNLRTREQVEIAYATAREQSPHVMVERFVPGADHRLLVVGGRLVAAALREPAMVVGDSRSTVAELVAEANRDPSRSDGHATALSFIKLDLIGLAVLAEQGYTPESVPPAGARVLIRRNANLSTGGTATDVTDRVHPEAAARAVEAARAVGLDIAGVDVVAEDIGRPLEEQGGSVVEVNAGPGLRMHLEPSAGTPRDVGSAVVDMLFPPGETGRIPVVAVTGVNGKTTTTRLLAHLLRQAGHRVGMTCTDGMYLDGRRTEAHDCSGPRSARKVLLNPRVTAAVLETARGGILREGLGFDHCDVAVVTNIGRGDHFGLRGIETPEDLARVKRAVVEAVAPRDLCAGCTGGAAVLNVDDPLVAAMAGHCPGSVIYFARAPDGPVVWPHRAAGGRAVLARGGSAVLAEGGREEVLLPLARVPLTHGGGVAFQVENVLAAAAAAWALGLPLEAVRAGLESFRGGAAQVPGRFNLFHAGGSTVVVDYAHNPSAVAALVAALDQLPGRRRSLVFTGCNRNDAEVVEMGEALGGAFDRVILYEDRGHSGRADGELNALLRRGLAAGKRVAEVTEAPGELEAVDAALGSAGPGELVVLGIESIEQVLGHLQARVRPGERGRQPPES
ncbi:MAG: cyanophycin synthetase [Gemmataceae bacterium]|nr:cyanophycin synthetase [Gemmataceae bacterium]